MALGDCNDLVLMKQGSLWAEYCRWGKQCSAEGHILDIIKALSSSLSLSKKKLQLWEAKWRSAHTLSDSQCLPCERLASWQRTGHSQFVCGTNS